MLLENERIDDLECRGKKIIQSKDGYCFTSDSVLLANLVNAGKNDKIVDLCTGSGVIAILMNAKYNPKSVIGVELQPRLADMARRSVMLNGDEERVSIVNEPVQNVRKIIGTGFDIVTVNPPYEEKIEDKEPTEEDICKGEYKLTLSETIKESAALLRFGGAFYMINKTRRMAETIYLLKENGIEPKKIYIVYPKINKNSDTFIVEGKRGGKPGLIMPPPLIVYDEKGNYTEEVRGLYNK